jgi:hypothetical protein
VASVFLVGRCSLPVVPLVEWRALPASLIPTIAVTPRPGATRSASAPPVGPCPPDPRDRPDGTTPDRTTDGRAGPFITNRTRLAATNGMWFAATNGTRSRRTTGFSLGGRGLGVRGRCFDLFFALGGRASIGDLSRDNDRQDNQDRNHDSAPHSVASALRLDANCSPWRSSPIRARAITAYW